MTNTAVLVGLAFRVLGHVAAGLLTLSRDCEPRDDAFVGHPSPPERTIAQPPRAHRRAEMLCRHNLPHDQIPERELSRFEVDHHFGALVQFSAEQA